MAGPGGKEVGRLSIKVLPDTSEFAKSLRAFAERMEKQIRVQLKVELNAKDAMADALRIKKELEASLRNIHAELEVDSSFARVAMTRLLATLRVMARVGRPRIRPDLDTGRAVTQMAAFNASSQLANSAAANIGRQILLWGPLIFAAAAGVAAIGPSLLALLPLLAGVGIGIGVIVMGWGKVQEALKPITEAFGEMRKQIGETLVSGLEPLIKTFADVFVPVVKEGLLQFAVLINGAAAGLFNFLSSAEGIQLVGTFLTGLAFALRPFAALTAPLTELFLRLSIAALPALELMGDAILRVVDGLNGWLSINDISGTISTSMAFLGQILAETGRLIAGLFKPLFTAAPAVISFLDGFISAFTLLLNALQPVFEWLAANSDIMQFLGYVVFGAVAAFLAFAAVSAVIAAGLPALIGAIVGGLVYAWNRFPEFRKVATDVFLAILDAGQKLWAGLQQVWDGILVAVDAVVDAFLFLWPTIQNVFSIIGSIISIWWSLVQLVFTGVVTAIQILIGAWQLVWQVISPVVSLIMGALGILWDFWTMVFTFLVERVMFWLGVLAPVGSFIAGVVSTVVGVVQGIVKGFGDMVTGVQGKISDLITKAQKIPGDILSALGDLAGNMLQAGKDAIQGLIDGIEEKAKAIPGKIADIAGDIAGGFKSALSIFSPSRVMRRLAYFVPAGIALGLEDGKPLVSSAMGDITGSIATAFSADTFTVDDNPGGDTPTELGPRSLAALSNQAKDVADRAIRTRNRSKKAQLNYAGVVR